MASLHVAQFELAFDFIDLLRLHDRFFLVSFLRPVVLFRFQSLLGPYACDSAFIFVATVSSDILVVSQLFSRWSVSPPLLLHASVVGTCVRPSEGLV